MSVKDVCTEKVITVEPSANLAEASKLMAENHVGSLVVVETYDGKKIPAGMITDRDLALAVGTTAKPGDLKVSQLMRSQPVTIGATDGIYEAIEVMETSGVKRLPVVDDTGALVGIVCADDLASLISHESAKLTKISELQAMREAGIRLPIKPTMKM